MRQYQGQEIILVSREKSARGLPIEVRAGIHQHLMGDRKVDFSFQILIFDSMRSKLLFTNTPKYQLQLNIFLDVKSVRMPQ
jgi:hypothetical protein